MENEKEFSKNGASPEFIYEVIDPKIPFYETGDKSRIWK